MPWTPTATLSPASGIGASVTASPTVTTTYTATGTATSGPTCTKTGTVNIIVNPLATLSGVSATTVCSGSNAIVILSGLLPNSSSNIKYKIGSGTVQSYSFVVSNASGLGTLPIAVSYANNGQVLTIVSISSSINSGPSCLQNFSTGNTTTLTVNPTPTLTDALLAAPVCENSGAIVNLPGLLPNTTSTINYMINGIAQTPVTGVIADASGFGNFTTPILTLANNNQILRVTGVTTTSSTPNCSASFVKSLTLKVDQTTAGGTFPSVSTCSAGNGILTLTGNIGGVKQWEFSTNGGSLWTSITTNMTNNQAYTVVPQTTLYRVLVKSGACPSLYSTIAVVGIRNM